MLKSCTYELPELEIRVVLHMENSDDEEGPQGYHEWAKVIDGCRCWVVIAVAVDTAAAAALSEILAETIHRSENPRQACT